MIYEETKILSSDKHSIRCTEGVAYRLPGRSGFQRRARRRIQCQPRGDRPVDAAVAVALLLMGQLRGREFHHGWWWWVCEIRDWEK